MCQKVHGALEHWRDACKAKEEETVWASAEKRQFKAWYKMYPELAMVEKHVPL